MALISEGKCARAAVADDATESKAVADAVVRVFDVARAMVSCETMADIARVLHALLEQCSRADAQYRVVRVKHRFRNPTAAGCRMAAGRWCRCWTMGRGAGMTVRLIFVQGPRGPGGGDP